MTIFKVEEKLTELFNTIPVYELEPGVDSDKLFFHFGEQKALDQVLLAKQVNGQNAYPLLWYKLPNSLSANNIFVQGDFEFILAHNTKLDYFNDQRFNIVFNKVLFPNLNLVMQSLFKAKNVQINRVKGNDFYEYSNYPNYGNPTTFSGKDESKQIDYWDAIWFKVNLTINNNCMGDISYNINNII